MMLKDIGEWKAVERILELLGIDNEDCACIKYNDIYLLATVDSMSASTHFPSLNWRKIGWFSCAISLSDISAMGGIPLGMMLSIMMPSSETYENYEEILKGAEDCASKFNTKIVGGDTKECSAIVISSMCIGYVEENLIAKRIGAKEGDIVIVTGELGRAERGMRTGNIDDIFSIEPRIYEMRKAVKTGGVTSAMDISDGLSKTLYTICKLSNVGMEIEMEKIPIIKGGRYEGAMFYGGDYEVLMTVKEDVTDEILQKIDSARVIGKVISGRKVIIKETEEVLREEGYEHFR